jgi:hypothetical protein
VDRRPDPLWREHPARSRRRVLLIVLGLTAVYVALIALKAPGTCSAPGGGPCRATPHGSSITSVVERIAPLPERACVAEVRRFHYSISVARSLCAPGSDRPWFRARVTNDATATYVRCNVDGFRGGRRVARRVPLPVGVVQLPAGMHLNRRQTRTVEWYFDSSAPTAITTARRFVARCQPNPNPPM